MGFILTGANIVLLAKNHNPSIVSKEWLTKNKIIREKIVNFTHLPVASMIETENFNLLVEQEILQLSIKNIGPEALKELPEIISKYINQLPETPYTAIGFNYLYITDMKQQKLKKIFLIDDKKLIETFSEDYKFGGIINFPFEDFKVTLTIQPTNNEETKLNFNFHFPSKNRNKITEKLHEHDKTKTIAKEVLRRLFNDQN